MSSINQPTSSPASSVPSNQGTSNQNVTNNLLADNRRISNLPSVSANSQIFKSDVPMNRILEMTHLLAKRRKEKKVTDSTVDNDDCQIIKHVKPEEEVVILKEIPKKVTVTVTQGAYYRIKTKSYHSVPESTNNVPVVNEDSHVEPAVQTVVAGTNDAGTAKEPGPSTQLKEKESAAKHQQPPQREVNSGQKRKNEKSNTRSAKKSKKLAEDMPSTSGQSNQLEVVRRAYKFNHMPEMTYSDFSDSRLSVVPFSKALPLPQNIITLGDEEKFVSTNIEIPCFVTEAEMGFLVRWMKDRKYDLEQRSKFLIHRLFMGPSDNVKEMKIIDFYRIFEIAVRRAISDGGDGLEKTTMNIGIHHPELENGVVYFDNIVYADFHGTEMVKKIREIQSWNPKVMLDENLKIQVDVVLNNIRSIVIGKKTRAKALLIAHLYKRLKDKTDILDESRFLEIVNSESEQNYYSSCYKSQLNDSKFLKETSLKRNSRIVLISENETKLYNARRKKAIRLLKIGTEYDAIIPFQC